MIRETFTPASLEEAATLKRENAIYFSGGTQINWAPSKINAERVILLEGLLPVDVKRSDTRVEIGAGITLQALIDSLEVPETLRAAAAFIPSRCVRNMATLGGNIAANRTDSSVIPALIALKAEVKTLEKGVLSVEEYISHEEDALISKVFLPEVHGVSMVDKIALSTAASPTLTMAVRIADDEAVIALGCLSNHVIRLQSLEERILSGGLETEEDIFDAVYSTVHPSERLKESSAYRRYITATMIARAVTDCKRRQA